MGLLDSLRFFLYHLLSRSSKYSDRVRVFRFGFPFVLKKTEGRLGTEAEALRLLNKSFTKKEMPLVPRLYDSLVVNGDTYTLMSKLPGKPILEWIHPNFKRARLFGSIVIPDHTPSLEECREWARQVERVFRRIWTVPQPPHLAGQVFASADGHGILWYIDEWETRQPPRADRLELYHEQWGYDSVDAMLRDYPQAAKAFNTPIVFTHTDPYFQNILVSEDGSRVTGIIDWDNAAWLPLHYAVRFLVDAPLGSCCNHSWNAAWGETQSYKDVQEAHELWYTINNARSVPY